MYVGSHQEMFCVLLRKWEGGGVTLQKGTVSSEYIRRGYKWSGLKDTIFGMMVFNFFSAVPSILILKYILTVRAWGKLGHNFMSFAKTRKK